MVASSQPSRGPRAWLSRHPAAALAAYTAIVVLVTREAMRVQVPAGHPAPAASASAAPSAWTHDNDLADRARKRAVVSEVQALLDVDAGSSGFVLLLREHHFDRASNASFIVKSMSDDGPLGAEATIEIDSGDKPAVLRVRKGSAVLVEAEGKMHRFKAVEANSVGLVFERGAVESAPNALPARSR